MKKITKLMLFVIVVSLTFYSCVDEDKFTNPVHFDLDNGAFAKFNNIPPAVLDIETPGGPVFNETINDANNNMIEYQLDLTAILPSGTIEVPNFINLTSFPSDISISAQTLSDALNIDVATLTGGEIFNFLATATRSDGQIFSGENATFDDETLEIGIGNTETTLNAAPNYKSAMKFAFVFACPLDNPTIFTGTYLLENLSDAAFGPVFGTGPFEVDLEVVPNTADTGRTINVNYLQDLGIGQDNIDFQFNLICDTVVASVNQGTNLTCGGGGILLGPGGIANPYDENDDSVIEITFDDGWEGNDGGCGFSPTEVTIRLTKQ